MFTPKRAILAASLLPRDDGRCRVGRDAQSRQADRRGRHRGLGHQHPARWHRTAERQRHAGAGRVRSSPKNARPVTATTARAAQAAALVSDSQLAGINAAQKTIKNFWPYSTTIFDFIRRAMPFQMPRSLTDDEVYALTAYILAENKLIGANDAMDAQTLPKVKMPNRDNFIIRFPDRI